MKLMYPIINNLKCSEVASVGAWHIFDVFEQFYFAVGCVSQDPSPHLQSLFARHQCHIALLAILFLIWSRHSINFSNHRSFVSFSSNSVKKQPQILRNTVSFFQNDFQESILQRNLKITIKIIIQ